MAKSRNSLRNLPLRPLLDALDAATDALRRGEADRALRYLREARKKFNGNCFSFRVVEYPAEEQGRGKRPPRRPPRKGPQRQAT